MKAYEVVHWLQVPVACLCLALGLAAMPAAPQSEKETLQLTSPAFAEGASIPAKYTCDGKNISPPLRWSGVPAGARSLVLIADDPDAPAGTWVHWLIYDLPATVSELPEGLAQGQHVLGSARQGLNSFKHLGYGGPCPPPGKPHRYFFKLYALDAPLELKPGATRKEVERAMEKHVLAHGELMGSYKRQ